MSMKTLISTAALIAGMTAVAPATQAADWSLSADFVGEYVFRGVTLGAESIQTGAEVTLDNGLTLGVWGNAGFGEQSLLNGDEVDFYAGYTVPVSDTFGLDLGATLYHYPQLGGIFDIGTGAGDASTLEFSAGTSFGGTLDPSLTLYYDTTLETFTLEGGAGYSIATGEATSLDLSGSLGAVEPDGGTSYQYAQLGAALSYAFSDAASGYVGLNAGASTEDTFADVSKSITDPGFGAAEASSIWYGIGLSTGF